MTKFPAFETPSFPDSTFQLTNVRNNLILGNNEALNVFCKEENKTALDK